MGTVHGEHIRQVLDSCKIIPIEPTDEIARQLTLATTAKDELTDDDIETIATAIELRVMMKTDAWVYEPSQVAVSAYR